MKPIIGICVPLIFLFLSTAMAGNLPPPEFKERGRELIEKLCEKSEDKAFCVDSLGARPEADTASAVQLGVIILTMASSNASETSFYIKSKRKTHNLEPALEETLHDCSASYLDAVAQLDDSLAAILVNAYTDVDVWLDAAISDGESCETSLNESEGKDEELARRNKTFLKLAKDALLINRILTP